jgi:hypothetical protein
MNTPQRWDSHQGPVAPPRRLSKSAWIGTVLFLTLGSLALAMYFFSDSGLVPEKQLTLVEGTPSNVKVWSRRKRAGSIECMKFTVGGYETYISEYHPKYDAVRSAVRGGGPLKVWLETKKKYSGDDRPLYKLMAGSRMVVSYEDTVQERSKEHGSSLVVGIALVVMSGVYFSACCVRELWLPG